MSVKSSATWVKIKNFHENQSLLQVKNYRSHCQSILTLRQVFGCFAEKKTTPFQLVHTFPASRSSGATFDTDVLKLQLQIRDSFTKLIERLQLSIWKPNFRQLKSKKSSLPLVYRFSNWIGKKRKELSTISTCHGFRTWSQFPLCQLFSNCILRKTPEAEPETRGK